LLVILISDVIDAHTSIVPSHPGKPNQPNVSFSVFNQKTVLVCKMNLLSLPPKPFAIASTSDVIDDMGTKGRVKEQKD